MLRCVWAGIQGPPEAMSVRKSDHQERRMPETEARSASLRPAVMTKRRGFTIIEVLVVTAIAGILIALLVPVIQKARETSRKVACSNKLRQLSLALHHYHATHAVLPPGSQVIDFFVPPGYSKGFGWTIAVLPYVEESSLYGEFDFRVDCQLHHRHLTNRIVKSFVCPSDPSNGGPTEWTHPAGPNTKWGDYYRGGWGTTNYLGVSGVGGSQEARRFTDCDMLAESSRRPSIHSGMFFGNSSIRLADVTDGLSNTSMLVERGGVESWGKWGGAGEIARCPYGNLDVSMPGVFGENGGGGLRAPRLVPSDRLFVWSWHDGGSQYALADGSVRFVAYSMDHKLQLAVTTRAQGEVFGEW
jgi:prepilin-type N-terminal cleavage/methylation domain-containing protein/prepilin-type processing-associated H-X9-DG protein